MRLSNPAVTANRFRLLLLLLVPLAVLVAFWPTLQADFISWDDDANFLNNPHFRGLGWRNLRWMFTTLHMSNYQPLSWLVSALGYALWGMRPAGYHAVSLALHMLNAVLVYLVAARLLRLAAPREDGVALSLSAAFAALFFALHPLRVEPVAWLSGQHDLLAGVFYLLAILCHLRACAEEARRRRWLAGCAALFAAAMLAKSNGITLPFALLLLDVYPLRRLPSDPRRWPNPRHRRVWLEKLPLLAVAVAAGVVNLVARHETAGLPSLRLAFRLQESVYGAALYLGKTMVPLRLSPFYPVPLDLRLSPTTVVASAGLLLFLTAVLFGLRRSWRGGVAAWAYYLFTLLPVLGLVTVGTQLAADRYTYLPCLAWALLGGGAAMVGLRRLRPRRHFLLAAGLGAVLLVLAGLSWRQSRLWRDSETLFRYALSLNPNIPEVHNALGLVLVSHRRMDEGMAQYRQALAIKPDFVRARNNLGLALIGQARYGEAAAQFREALEVDPDYAFGHNNLGLALMYLDQTAAALGHFQRAVDLVPDYVVAHNNLGGALLALGRIDEAIPHFQKALALRPDYEDAATMLRIAEAQRSR